jgi:hypothetical protein
MVKSCSQRTISLRYPKHLPAPEDILSFVESADFTTDWAALGLDDEDDMVSLQLCIMSHPEGDSVVPGTNGLRIHRHYFHGAAVNSVTIYYAYFQAFGFVYMNCVDTSKERLKFSQRDLFAINESIQEVEAELERLKTIRVRRRSVESRDGGDNG